MNKKIKFFITVLLVLLISCGCMLAASADEIDTDVTVADGIDTDTTPTDNTDTEATDGADADVPVIDGTDTGTAVTDDTGEAPQEPFDQKTDMPQNDGEDNVSSNEAEDVNFFTRLFDEIKAYATEIFCAMTFIGSVILAYAYKKGLLPLIKGALSSITHAVGSIKERTEANEESSSNFNKLINERLSDAEDTVRELGAKIEELSVLMNEINQSELMKNEDTKKLQVIVETQIDMLYEIFMTSALPQYEKDSVGERVAKMKEALSLYETK